MESSTTPGTHDHPSSPPNRPVLSPKVSTGAPILSRTDRCRFVSGVSRG